MFHFFTVLYYVFFVHSPQNAKICFRYAAVDASGDEDELSRRVTGEPSSPEAQRTQQGSKKGDRAERQPSDGLYNSASEGVDEAPDPSHERTGGSHQGRQSKKQRSDPKVEAVTGISGRRSGGTLDEAERLIQELLM